MNLNEIEEQLAIVEKRRKSFDTNRSLSALVVVFLLYQMYQGYKEGSTSWWFYAIMVVFTGIAVLLVVFDSKKLKVVNAEYEELKAQKARLQAEAENDDDEADDGEDVDGEESDSDDSGDGGADDTDDACVDAEADVDNPAAADGSEV